MDAAQLEIRPPKSAFLSGSSVSYVDKEIEFVPARKRFNGLAYSNGDFKIETLNASGPLETSGKIGQANQIQVTANKSDAPDALESWMDQELSFRVSFQRIGAGLQNLGNTCFLNSVLQCLTYTEPLAAYLQTGKHQSSCRINGFCALCAIQKHVSRALQATGKSLAPKDLVSNLRCISRSFRNARQEDAHEYMVNLLESMHKCCLPSGVPSESPSAYEKSLVHKIFGGRLRSQVKCLQCNYCSNKFDPFIDLSLEITKADSVLKALGHFTAAEHLDGGTKQYQCQKCKEKVRALKQLTVHKAPYVLTIHLKRFHSLNPGEKINKTVRFDTKLDLKPFVSGPYVGDLKYSLYGVLIHHGGSTRSGHYLCYVRTSTNMWYLLNDNTVMQVRESSVLQQKAYMLFYIRNRDTTPRKNAEISPKEILKEHYIINRESFSFSQNSSCDVQFSQIKEKSGSSFSSCSVVAKEMVPVNKADRIMNGASVNCSTVSGSVPSAKEIKKPSTPTSLNIEGEFEKSATPISSNSKFNDHSQKDSTASVAQPPVSNDLKDGADNAMVEQRMPHENTCDKIKTVGSMVSGKQPSCKINNVNLLKESQNAADDEKSTREESVVLTTTANTDSESSQAEKIDNKCESKTKKNHTKYQLTITHFGTNVFLRASMGARKKLMKKKHRSSKIKKDCANSDLGPSTSESRKPDKVKSHKKRKKGQEAKISSDVVGRTAENGAALASEFQASKNSSTTESSQTKAKAIETTNDGKDNMQNCFVSMLTRGIEETIVAHWDDVNTAPSPTMESNAAVTSIGHVLDEWDEEYDRGKRKKVRLSQHEFGGPNLFQQAASDKLKSKKSKFDRARFGNQPFRV